ncbi:MAG TPA: RNA methyltransferase [Candidatus Krumholzibacteria bacterium]|nr:RNA methyltransferase [Candidatus Krumholzibacteria bacterium]
MAQRSFRRIESDRNALYQALRRGLSGREIRREGVALVSGPKTIRDIVRALPGLCEAWVSSDGQPEPPMALPEGAFWYQLSARLFKSLDIFGTGAPLLLVRIPPLAAWEPGTGLPRGCSLLVPFQDPENVGAVIRSAVAFGVRDVILLEGSGHPYHPKAMRASSGAVFHANLMTGPLIDALPDDLPVVPLSAGGADAASAQFPERFALLPGVEGPGLPARFRGRALSIPIDTRVESLNAATATAIVLFLWSRTRR